MPKPALGRNVLYRSRTGKYTVPAVITATHDTLFAGGVEAGHVPALSSPDHVHLTVFTPGKPMMRVGADDFLVESPHGRGENVSGCYQEWDVPLHLPGSPDVTAEQLTEPGDGGEHVQAPGTYAWPIIDRG